MGSAPSSFLSKETFSWAASLLVLGRHPEFDSPVPIPSWLLWSFLRWSFLSFALEPPLPTTTFVDALLPIAPEFPFRFPLMLMLLPFADEWLSAWWKMFDVFCGSLLLHRKNFSSHHNKTFTNQHILDAKKKKRKEEQNPANSNTATWEEIGLVASRFPVQVPIYLGEEHYPTGKSKLTRSNHKTN